MARQYRGPRGAYQRTIGRMSDVARIRMAKGWTQGRLAEAAGCSERAVREHERYDWPDGKEAGRLLHRQLLDALR